MGGCARHQWPVALSVAIAATTLCGPLARPAGAEQPVAIVEAVRAPAAGVQVFDYLRPGRVVRLGESGRLVLGYLRSCLRETITGGEVVVGTMESAVRAL